MTKAKIGKIISYCGKLSLINLKIKTTKKTKTIERSKIVLKIELIFTDLPNDALYIFTNLQYQK